MDKSAGHGVLKSPLSSFERCCQNDRRWSCDTALNILVLRLCSKLVQSVRQKTSDLPIFDEFIRFNTSRTTFLNFIRFADLESTSSRLSSTSSSPKNFENLLKEYITIPTKLIIIKGGQNKLMTYNPNKLQTRDPEIWKILLLSSFHKKITETIIERKIFRALKCNLGSKNGSEW